MGLVRGIIWVAVFAGVVYGVFWLSSSKLPENESLRGMEDAVTGTISELQIRASEEGEKIIQKSSETVGSYMKDAIRNTFSSVGESIAEFGETIVGEDAERKSPQEDSPEDSPDAPVRVVVGEDPPVSTALLVSPGESISLFFQEGEFILFWGEGKEEEISGGSPEEPVIRSHTWNESGTYLVTVKSDDIVVYTLPVRVLQS